MYYFRQKNYKCSLQLKTFIKKFRTYLCFFFGFPSSDDFSEISVNQIWYTEFSSDQIFDLGKLSTFFPPIWFYGQKNEFKKKEKKTVAVIVIEWKLNDEESEIAVLYIIYQSTCK